LYTFLTDVLILGDTHLVVYILLKFYLANSIIILYWQPR